MVLMAIVTVRTPATARAIDPTAVAMPVNVTDVGGTVYSFTVRYADDGKLQSAPSTAMTFESPAREDSMQGPHLSA